MGMVLQIVRKLNQENKMSQSKLDQVTDAEIWVDYLAPLMNVSPYCRTIGSLGSYGSIY
jgi:hypothetical protein